MTCCSRNTIRRMLRAKWPKTAVQAAKDQLSFAQIQYDLAAQGAQSAMPDYYKVAWDKSPMDEFDRPAWYFYPI